MSYYLKSKTKEVDNRRKYGHFELYDDNELIKIFNKEASLSIIDKIKAKNIEPTIDQDQAYITDQRFIEYILKSKLKRNRVNKKLVGIIATAGIITFLGSSVINNIDKANTPIKNTYNNQIEFMDDNATTEESAKEDEIIEIDAKPLNEDNDEIIISAIPNGKEIKKDVIKFDAIDMSKTENVDFVNRNYKYMTDITPESYGIDSKLMNAIICVENPFNNVNPQFIGGHGVTQVEHINQNQNYGTFNFKINDFDYTGSIDVYRADSDPDYAIRVGSIIFANQYNFLNKKYGDKFSDAEILMAALLAYNKGISIVDVAMSNTNSFDEFKYYITINSSGGNNNYVEHVLSYIEDGTVIHMITDDKEDHFIEIDNINVEKNDAPKSL